jgi:cellulose synthase/poly-beta-1,6-N-acetylglucosamine synthase-like glycosyltransferase
MHVRRDALEAAGAWDPHNVTEDADLGVRLHRLGYRTEVLDSVTLEEANSDFVNWIKQRSRWYKGYLQTWLVHIRNPVRLWRELGTRGFVGFNVVVGATPLLAALNPVFWLLTLLWFAGRPGIVQALFPAWLYYPALASLAGGNFIAVYRTVVAVRVAGRTDLLRAALCSPLYWTMMSIAAIRAIAQLVVKPSHWEKTVHGLGRPRTEMRAEAQRA